MRRTLGFGLGFASIALLAVSIPVASADFDGALVVAFREAALQYRSWGRVDDEVRFAPYLCRLPMRSRARVSEASAGHGRKVYFLYANDRLTYVDLARQRLRPGFTVVKESFRAAQLEPSERFDEVEVPHGDPYLPLRDGDRFIGAGEPAGLYMMRYVGRREGTDAGWVYGTVDAAGEVTAAGRIASCMDCHRDAPHGRLFGLPTRDD